MSTISCHRQQLAECDRRKVEHRNLIYYRTIDTIKAALKKFDQLLLSSKSCREVYVINLVLNLRFQSFV